MRKDWEVKKLGEICLSIKDGSHNPPKGIESGSYLMLSSQNIQDGYIDFKNSRFISEDDFRKEQKRVKVKKGDLLLTIVGTIGRSCVFDGSIDNIVFQRSVAVLTPKVDIVPFFLRYFIKSKKTLLENEAKGVAQKGIYLKQLSDFKISVPPLQIQQQIVEELDCLTSIIEKQKKQLEELDNLAQSIFYDMFGDPIENEHGWETQLIGDVCKFSQGVQVDLPLQSVEPKEGWNRFLRISDYTIGDIELRYVDIQEQKYYVYSDDVVIVRYGASAGFVGINKEGILANNLFKLNHDKSILDYKFLYYYLSTDYYREFIQKVAFGAAMPALSFNSFKSFKMFIPPLSLQQQFAAKIEAIEKQKELIKKSIKETEDLFNSRMDYYFN